MGTAYLVSSGDYSDYHIDAVFDNKEMAEEFVQRFSIGGWGEKLYIDERELNPDIPQIREGLVAYRVHMAKDGTALLVKPLSEYEYDEHYVGAAATHAIGAHFPDEGRGVVALVTRCYAQDKQHAVKIANEHRVQLIANGEW